MGAQAAAIGAIMVVALTRLFRDRVGLFFVLALPLILVVVIGSAAFGGAGGGGALTLVVADEDGGPLARELVERLDESPGLTVRRESGADAVRAAVRRGQAPGGLIVPAGYDAAVRAGGTIEVALVSDPARATSGALRANVAAVVNDLAARARAAAFAASATGRPFDETYRLAATAEGAGVEVAREAVAARSSIPRGFSYPTIANMILFMFVTSMAGAADLILARQLGVTRRMLATPTTPAAVLLGTALGRFAIAMFQGLFIVGVGVLVFRVDLGDPVAAAVVVVAFALVSSAVAMLLGTLFRTPDQAGAMAAPVGIALGMLGGCMWPLEIVPEPMRVAGHLTPHAWAMDALLALMARGSDLAGILPQLAVLLLFAAVLLPLSVWRLARAEIR